MSTGLNVVTIKQEMPADVFWSEIMGSGWEGFGTHWYEAEFIEGDWDTPGVLRVVINDPALDEGEQPGIEATINLDQLVAAYELAWSSSQPDWPFPSEGIARSYLDLENLDCIGGDGILQCAVLGKVVYG
jgi:hypothetical protein